MAAMMKELAVRKHNLKATNFRHSVLEILHKEEYEKGESRSRPVPTAGRVLQLCAIPKIRTAELLKVLARHCRRMYIKLLHRIKTLLTNKGGP